MAHKNTKIRYAWEAIELHLRSRQDTMESHTLKVISSNSRMGCLFPSASVVTQERLSMFPICTEAEKESYILQYKQIWDIAKMRQLIAEKQSTEGTDEPIIKKLRHISDAEHAAYATLDCYISDFEKHYQCLKKVLDSKEKPCESEIMKVLYAHLFDPLSNGNCYIEKHILETNDGCDCPCGCSQRIQRGDTGLGVEYTWHGYVDMFIQGNVPVSVVNKRTDSKLSGDVKKECDSCKLSDSQKSGTCRFIAETITNAFAQSNTNTSLNGLPIPAFGCTRSHILVHLYDCKNDFLLKKTSWMNILIKEDFLSTVVYVWLYINFALFMRKDVTKLSNYPELQRFAADFCESQSVISIYESVQSGVAEFRHFSKEPDLIFVHHGT